VVFIVYRIVFSKGFAQQLKKVVRSKGERYKGYIFTHIDELEIDPYRARPGCDIKRISGQDHSFRLRIGDLRVLYEVDVQTEVIYVTAIFTRGKGYRL